ncbi:MAG: hypothetical protein L0Y57_14820, partial [Beijerinckiaceae bacterium]|nr:hypothetical protein [Beijerinckiaceae bacterium]
MMALPVAQFLARFESPDSAAKQKGVSRVSECPELQEEAPGHDAAEAMRAAREEAFAEGFSAAEREIERQLAKERQEF